MDTLVARWGTVQWIAYMFVTLQKLFIKRNRCSRKTDITNMHRDSQSSICSQLFSSVSLCSEQKFTKKAQGFTEFNLFSAVFICESLFGTEVHQKSTGIHIVQSVLSCFHL
ncbi:hypothetical protein BDC45DRAFT_532197 [Circinella umbellata]|nr:hypothetical protein BDC45DRAFT_532197 [Circinella umbellata]